MSNNANGVVKQLIVFIGLIGVMLGIYFALIRPSVYAAVTETIKTERAEIRVDIEAAKAEAVKRDDEIKRGHQRDEERLDKRLDRIESKLDDLRELIARNKAK